MIFPVNGFTVDYDGPTRNFYAWHFYAPDGKTHLKFGDYEENVKKGDKGRLSIVYDKGKLIEGLMKEAEKNGVEVFTGVNVTGVEKTAEGLKVTGNGDTFAGTFVIGADGTGSRVAQLSSRCFTGRWPVPHESCQAHRPTIYRQCLHAARSAGSGCPALE